MFIKITIFNRFCSFSNWDYGLGPENTSVTFGAIILNGVTVIAFTRQVSAADVGADQSEIHTKM